jgi:cell division protein FtsB
VGQDAIDSVLNEFLRASYFPNWLEYLKTRHEIILDQKYLQVSEIEKSNQNLTESLQAEVEALKLENTALKEKIEKIKSDISQLLQD